MIGNCVLPIKSVVNQDNLLKEKSDEIILLKQRILELELKLQKQTAIPFTPIEQQEILPTSSGIDEELEFEELEEDLNPYIVEEVEEENEQFDSDDISAFGDLL